MSKVRCVDCGFLGTSRSISFAQTFALGELSIVDRASVVRREYHSPDHLECFRGVWQVVGDTAFERYMDDAAQPRDCRYFHRHNPGHSPAQHLELLRERKTRRYMILASIVGGLAGGSLALVAQAAWALLSQPR